MDSKLEQLMKKTIFLKLNTSWNAEPNIARPMCFNNGDVLFVIFKLNKYIFPENPEQTIGMLKFENCSRYRIGETNKDAWFMGDCRFSKLAPEWGDFYQVSGNLLLEKCDDDWIEVSPLNNNFHHYLFYFRDKTFECDAINWRFEALDVNKEINTTSKFLSLILRHKPDEIELLLDDIGWLKISDIITKSQDQGFKINLELILKTVFTNKKQRFSLSKDGKYIRANQGHSITVDTEISPKKPPDFLFHGTATRFLDSIENKGIIKSGRLHVHLSEDIFTAKDVGSRYGTSVVIEIDSKQMYKDGVEFYQSKNGVWLTDFVDIEYFKIIKHYNTLL